MQEKPFSYSSISTYLECSRKFWYRYKSGVKAESRPAYFVSGAAVHRTMQHLANNIEARSHWSAIYEQFWQNELEEESIELSGDGQGEHDAGLTIIESDTFEQMVNQMRIVAPFEVEHKLVWTVPGSGVDFVGYIDLIDQSGIPYDIKTSSKRWNAKQADQSLQATLYIDGLIQTGRFPADQLVYPFRYIILVKTKTVQCQILHTTRDWADIRAARRVVLDAAPYMLLPAEQYRGVQQPILNPRDNWKCNYCPYLENCRPFSP